VRGIIGEFKEFINRGNMIDLAVAVVLGAAFGAVVTSFTNDIFGGLLGAIGGQPSLADLSLTIGSGEIRWGAFVDSIISFLIIALAIFLIVKAVNTLQAMRVDGQAAEEEAEETEIDVLKEIRDQLRERS
jgi:large conductance mechanosensitive channel